MSLRAVVVVNCVPGTYIPRYSVHIFIDRGFVYDIV